MPKGHFTRDYEGRAEASTDDEYVRGLVRGKHELLVDEPPDLPVGAGNDDHPSPVDYLAFSLASCQVSVLKQALERARIEEFDVTADWLIDDAGTDDVAEEMPSNTMTRVRHISIDVTLEVPPEFEKRAQRILDVYDSGCIVGQSLTVGVEYTPETTLVLTDE